MREIKQNKIRILIISQLSEEITFWGGDGDRPLGQEPNKLREREREWVLTIKTEHE